MSSVQRLTTIIIFSAGWACLGYMLRDAQLECSTDAECADIYCPE